MGPNDAGTIGVENARDCCITCMQDSRTSFRVVVEEGPKLVGALADTKRIIEQLFGLGSSRS